MPEFVGDHLRHLADVSDASPDIRSKVFAPTAPPTPFFRPSSSQVMANPQPARNAAWLAENPVVNWPQAPLVEAIGILEPDEAIATAHVVNHAIVPLQQRIAQLELQLQTLDASFDAFRLQQGAANQQLLANAGGTTRARFPEPPEFAGDRAQFSVWKSQVSAYLAVNSGSYQTEEQKCLYALQKLRGSAYSHVQAWVDSAGTATPAAEVTSWAVCLASLKSIFGPIDEEGDARRTLKAWKHTTSVDAYAAEYRRLGALSKFGDTTLCSMFEDGLKREIRDRFVGRTRPDTLSEWVSQATTIERDLAQLNHQVRSQRGNSGTHQATPARPPAAAPRDPNAMEIDKVTQEERLRRRIHGLCFYCGNAGHVSAKCPAKTQPRARISAAAAPGASPTAGATSSTSGVETTTSTAAGNNSGSPAMNSGSSAASNASTPLEGSPGDATAFASFVRWSRSQAPSPTATGGGPVDF